MTGRVLVAPVWVRAIDRYREAAHAAGLSASTVSTRATALRNLARTVQDDVGPYEVTGARLRAYVDGRTWAPSTYRANVKAIRAFYRWLHDEGLVDVDPARDLPVALAERTEDRMRARALAAPERAVTGPDRLPVPPVWADWLARYRRYMRAGGQSAATECTRLQQLSTFARAVDPVGPGEVTFDDALDYLGSRPDWAPEMRRSVRASLRSFYVWAVGDGLVEVSPVEGLPRVRVPVGVPRPAGEAMIADALVGADDRVRLMIRLSAELGLRRAEVAGLHADDLQRDTGGWTMRVEGKGRKVRVLPVPDGLAAVVRSYGRPGEFVFGDAVRHTSPRYVGELVAQQLPRGVTMHQLRHRFATQAYRGSRDLLAVQRLLGHSSVATTQRYVAPADDSLRSIVAGVGIG